MANAHENIDNIIWLSSGKQAERDILSKLVQQYIPNINRPIGKNFSLGMDTKQFILGQQPNLNISANLGKGLGSRLSFAEGMNPNLNIGGQIGAGLFLEGILSQIGSKNQGIGINLTKKFK